MVNVPRYQKVLMFACGVLMLSISAGYCSEVKVQRFVQDRFAIGFWIDPPADKDMDARYAEIAAANFSIVIGGFGARTPQDVERQLALCDKYGLKGIVARTAQDPNEWIEGSACWGYSLYDEPSTKDFPRLQERVSAIRKVRPGRLSFINLHPSYKDPCTADPCVLGVNSYYEYVSRFVKEVDVDVLCMDHYPMLKPDNDGRDGYCRNLDVMRQYALEKKIPFWNFFNTMPFNAGLRGQHVDPTESQLRWQIYSSLAYGAKGVLYFCYWTPQGPDFPKGGAIIRPDGRKTRHYDQARRINAELKKLGPTLMQLTSRAVYRIKPDTDADKVLKQEPLVKLSPGDYLMGVFDHADGRRAVLLNNYSFAYTQWPTVEFGVESSAVLEVDPETGNQRPVIDDSPDMPGLQLSLDAGMGRLFLLPKR